MKNLSILALTALASVFSTSVGAQEAPLQMDMQEFQNGDSVQMLIIEASETDANGNSKSVFGAGMGINLPSGVNLTGEATIVDMLVEENEKTFAADGTITGDDTSLEKTKGASAGINFSENIETEFGLDGRNSETQNSSSVEL